MSYLQSDTKVTRNQLQQALQEQNLISTI